MAAPWLLAATAVACGEPVPVQRADHGIDASGGAASPNGASGSGGTGSGGIDLSFGGGGAFSAGGTAASCVTETAEARPTPLDIALLVDNSFSMDFELRWQHVRGALLTFVQNPRFSDLGLSLQFFPLRAQCNVDDYASPAVPMAELSASRSEVQAVLAARRMDGGTPLVQALQGMGRYAADWAAAHPDRKAVVVLATDGLPDATCAAASFDPPNGLGNAASVAESLFVAEPSIPVFVVGVGDELSSLDAIAFAGGTGSAILVEDGADAQSEFLAALAEIRRESIACEYMIPEPNSGTIDYEAVNVTYSSGGPPATFYYVESPGDCALEPESTWYYDDAESPQKVLLCPKTCDRVTASSNARVDIAYGCRRADLLR